MLRQHRHGRWRRHQHRRRPSLSIVRLLCLVFLCLAGCRRVSWQQLYDDAHQQLQQGYYEKAIANAADGRARAQNKDALWSWKFRILEAEALMRAGEPGRAIDLLGENPPVNFPAGITVRKRLVEGQALCRANRGAEGEALLNEAERLIPAAASPLQAELAFARGYCAFSSPAIARQYFEQAAELARTDDPFTAASALGNIGYILTQQARYDEAIDWFQKILPLAGVVKSELIEEKTLGNLGESYSHLGDFKGAIDKLEKAQLIAHQIGRLDDEEAWLVTLGRSYASLRDYPDKAEASYLHALSIAGKLHDVKTTNLCLHDLALQALAENDLPRAKSYWRQEAATIAKGSQAELDSWVDEEQIDMAERNLGRAEELLQRIDRDPRTSPSRRAFVQSQMGKAYWMEHKNAGAERMFRESIGTVEKELSRMKEQYRASFLDEHSDRFDAYINFLISQGRNIPALAEAEHLRDLTQDGRSRGPASAFSIAAVQRRLRGGNQVILDYHVTDGESFLWLITAKDVRLFHLPAHRELGDLGDRQNREIQDQRSISDSPASRQLYAALVQPAEKFIPHGAHVSIVPSKILWSLNFETLIVSGSSPHYWIEDVVVQNCSSLMRAAASGMAHGGDRKEMLLIGAPEEVNPAFPTLKYAGDEIRRVESHFPAAQERVISGAGATPEAYQASRPQQYRLIHFVTHGIPNEKVPMESAIVLSGTDSSYKLYAHDIVLTPLHADLVTISACYGAGKRWYVSEGMVGLGWAFMQAGARQVIAALWEVDDASTPELMDDFYGELGRHRSTADALRHAKLAMLGSAGTHKLPYYWGSLQLYIGL